MAYVLKIYEFNPGVDVSGALRAAKALIKLPSQRIEELAVAGYLPAAPSVAYEGELLEAAEFEYELSPERLVTRVRIGSDAPSSSPFKAIRKRASEDAGDALVLSRR